MLDHITRWIDDNAHPITGYDLDAPSTDLSPLGDMLTGADAVGLGMTGWSEHAPLMLNARMVRYLTEELGFRALAMEDNWTTAMRLDEYLRTGNGDARSLITHTWAPWQTAEFLALLEWMRDFNTRHPQDPVRVLGVDLADVDDSAYQAVVEYVSYAAGHLLSELEPHIAAIRPGVATAGQDQVAHAQAVLDLLTGIPADENRDKALQHARVIHAYHAYGDVRPESERHRAETIAWWHRHYGHKVMYWDGAAHTARGRIRIGAIDRVAVGGWLRDKLNYVSIWNSFGAAADAVPIPADDSADAAFAATTMPNYLVDLRALRAAPAEAGLDALSGVRVIGPGYTRDTDQQHRITGENVTDWFDIAAHTRETAPARQLS